LGSAAKPKSASLRKFSITARPDANSEIVGEHDDGSLGLEPPARFTGTAPFSEVWGKAPKVK